MNAYWGRLMFKIGDKVGVADGVQFSVSERKTINGAEFYVCAWTQGEVVASVTLPGEILVEPTRKRQGTRMARTRIRP